jgi:hypothetical protein
MTRDGDPKQYYVVYLEVALLYLRKLLDVFRLWESTSRIKSHLYFCQRGECGHVWISISHYFQVYLPLNELPLKIVWSRVLALFVGAERTDVSWRIVDKGMPDYLILPLESLESLSSFTPGTALYAAIMRSGRRMYDCMRC